MILVGQYDSPFTRRAAVTLHHYGVGFSRNTISVYADAAEMGKINPLVRIPSLILDSGEVLIDSGAIVDYLDETYGTRNALAPAYGPERRAILQAAALAAGAAEKAVQIVCERHFHNDATLSREWEARCLTQLTAALEHLEARCGEPWYFGDRVGHADVMIGCLAGYLRLRVPEAFEAGAYPKLEQISARCEALDGFISSRIGANEVMPERR